MKRLQKAVGRIFGGVLLLLFAGVARAAASEEIVLTGRAMGTTYRVRALADSATMTADGLQRETDALLERLTQQMSTYRADSELSRFNRQRETNWFAVSREFAVVVEEAQRISRLTGGAFDVTVDPLVRLWGFGPERRTAVVPSDEAIAKARRRVDYRRLDARLDPPALRKLNPELSVDLSAIAKGYAVDAVAALLVKSGAGHYLVEIGGELAARGHSALSHPWRVGIERPLDTGREIERVVELKDRALATSGDYRNFFSAAGRRYAHIIDPRTGRPAAHNLTSVSVAHDSCMTADALATGLTVLGPDAGFELAVQNNFACLFILRGEGAFTEKRTSAFAELLPR